MKSKKSTPTRNRIVAVDPGFDRMGVAVLEGARGQQELLFSDCLKTDRKLPHAERLLGLGLSLEKLLEEWRPEALAVEKLFFNKNTSSALGVAEARGMVIFEAMKAGLAVYEYGPQDVKIAVTGYGHADKSQVESMVLKLVAVGTGKRLDDELDAIALGITHLASHRPI